ncbi:MAG: hypothetical protein KAS07_03605 [Candidatus Pacebacteria bacterium]|nr:hypothetical protein [Candidatus Paceibacterota bacterium]
MEKITLENVEQHLDPLKKLAEKITELNINVFGQRDPVELYRQVDLVLNSKNIPHSFDRIFLKTSTSNLALAKEAQKVWVSLERQLGKRLYAWTAKTTFFLALKELEVAY